MSDWADWPPYGLDRRAKSARLVPALRELTAWHAERCPPYARILRARGVDPHSIETLAGVPFLPVRLFKHEELRSVERSDVVKVLTSSGTTSQPVSRIFLDRATAAAQTRAIARIVPEVIGARRLPMLIIDQPRAIARGQSLSARGVGIQGLSLFGSDHTFALRDEDMSLDIAVVEDFLRRHGNEPILVFGFTFIVWKHFVQALARSERRLEMPGAVLLHSGGWKKLQDEAVDSRAFKGALRSVAGIDRAYNFYGMAEQAGSIFLECEQGHLHTPAFADVVVRDPVTLLPLPAGERGLVQVVSVLPRSYPGHSLLTEDEGAVLGEDDCSCGRLGVYFRIDGRLAQAEVRGCGDTYTGAATES